MNRFIDKNAEVSNLSTLRHASLDNVAPPIVNPIIRFYRGPLPATSNRPDNVYNFYQNQKYKSQRVYQPSLTGSLG